MWQSYMDTKRQKAISRNAKQVAFWSAVVVCLAVMTVIHFAYMMKGDDA